MEEPFSLSLSTSRARYSHAPRRDPHETPYAAKAWTNERARPRAPANQAQLWQALANGRTSRVSSGQW